MPHLSVAAMFGKRKLSWLGYRVVGKVWRYVKPFWHRSQAWQMDGMTDAR